MLRSFSKMALSYFGQLPTNQFGRQNKKAKEKPYLNYEKSYTKSCNNSPILETGEKTKENEEFLHEFGV